MSVIQSIKQVLGLSGTASENHFWDGSVPNQLSLKRGTPAAPGAELIKALNGALSFPSQGQSLAANGYVKLPGGLIVQWGSVAIGAVPPGNSGAAPQVILPVAFQTACIKTVTSTDDSNIIYSIATETLTTLDGAYHNPGANTSGAQTLLKYIALGY